MPTDNVIANAGSGGANFRTLADSGSIEWPASVVSVATTVSAGANVLQVVTAAAGLPVQPQTGATFPVSIAATVNTSAAQSGTWTVQPGNTANTTPWLFSINAGGNTATVSAAGALKVDGSAVTQPISAASLPLPTGAATAAKQPALGTAGTASADVITIQGIASMTAVKVDGSGVTQPVSGTVTANIGTTNGLALDTSVNGILVSQGSTTSGEKGPLIQGAVTTAAPSYTTAQTSPLSLTTAGGLRVDGSAVTQPVSLSGAVTVQQSTAANLKVDLSGTAANATAIKVDGSAVTQPVSGTVTVQQATAANLKVDLSGTAANATAIKVDGSAVTQPVSGTITANIGTTNGLALDATLTGGSQKAIPVAATAGGATPYHLISAASTNATSVKGSAGQIYSVTAFNTNASVRFLKLYDKASAPTVGTDTPVQTYAIPGNANGAGLTLSLPVGMVFANGIALALTTGMPDSDSGAVGANDCAVSLTYK